MTEVYRITWRADLHTHNTTLLCSGPFCIATLNEKQIKYVHRFSFCVSFYCLQFSTVKYGDLFPLECPWEANADELTRHGLFFNDLTSSHILQTVSMQYVRWHLMRFHAGGTCIQHTYCTGDGMYDRAAKPISPCKVMVCTFLTKHRSLCSFIIPKMWCDVFSKISLI